MALPHPHSSLMAIGTFAVEKVIFVLMADPSPLNSTAAIKKIDIYVLCTCQVTWNVILTVKTVL